MAAVESGGGFSQKRNTNSQVGSADLPKRMTVSRETLTTLPTHAHCTCYAFSDSLFDSAVHLCGDFYGLLIFSAEHMSLGWGMGR